jgi:hypothetical protein
LLFFLVAAASVVGVVCLLGGLNRGGDSAI